MGGMSTAGMGGLPALVIMGTAGIGAALSIYLRRYVQTGGVSETLRRGGRWGSVAILLFSLAVGVAGGPPAAVTTFTLSLAAVPLLWLAPMAIAWLLTGGSESVSPPSRLHAVLTGLPVALILAIGYGAAVRGSPDEMALWTPTLSLAIGWTLLVLGGPGLIAVLVLRRGNLDPGKEGQ